MSLAAIKRGCPHGDVRSQLYDLGKSASASTQAVKVLLDGEEVDVWVDPEKGPKVGAGPNDHMNMFLPSVPVGCPKQAGPGGHGTCKKGWVQMSASEQEVWVILTAKKNRAAERVQQAREERASSGR
mmetsp:Transcript_41860/g.84446  ORF Transcript_41860/g.84446 Transcript_41860/m.84446 type:complete len:127 (-) Transcript_41860:28-408(-)